MERCTTSLARPRTGPLILGVLAVALLAAPFPTSGLVEADIGPFDDRKASPPLHPQAFLAGLAGEGPTLDGESFSLAPGAPGLADWANRDHERRMVPVPPTAGVTMEDPRGRSEAWIEAGLAASSGSPERDREEGRPADPPVDCRRGPARLCSSWVHRTEQSPGGTSWIQDVAFGPDGTRLYQIGTTFGAGDAGHGDAFVTALNASNGEQRWRSTYRPGIEEQYGPEGVTDVGQALAVGPDGERVFAAVSSMDDPVQEHMDVVVVAYNATTGYQEWTRRYNGPDDLHDLAFEIAASPDGETVAVAGASESRHTEYQFDGIVLGFDTETGNQRWRDRFVGSGHGNDAFDGVAFSPDSDRVFTTGWTWQNETRFDFVTRGLDARDGAVSWTSLYDGPEAADGFSTSRDLSWAGVSVAPDGQRVYVAGPSGGEAGLSQFTAVAYDATHGTPVWTTRYDEETSDGIAADVAAGPQGDRVYLTGATSGRGVDYGTLALDADTGSARWYDQASGSSDYVDLGNDVEPATSGERVYVTGVIAGREDRPEVATERTASPDYGTFAYDARSGDRLWRAQADGLVGTAERPFAMEVNPGTGDLVVGGVTLSHQTQIHIDTAPPLTVGVQETSGLTVSYGAEGR